MVWLVFRKEILSALRFKAAWAAMVMFSLTALAAVSLSLYGIVPSPKMAASLLWLVLFFSASVGLDRMFGEEAAQNTLLALRVYGTSGAVLWGKLLYSLVLLLGLGIFTVAIFFLFIGTETASPFLFFLVLAAGLWGMAGAGVLIAALTVAAEARSGLFSVLLLPVLLPVLLPAIYLTGELFAEKGVELTYLGGIVLYDVILTLAASMLFDSLWQEL
ncbi:hypothetical protein TAMA11512_05640 [Selenomonas sp. TAMA-11512]|nr:hypothetical protein TAMA11512_05640 [Selenomonas sp. TAMA-11512]